MSHAKPKLEEREDIHRRDGRMPKAVAQARPRRFGLEIERVHQKSNEIKGQLYKLVGSSILERMHSVEIIVGRIRRKLKAHCSS